MDEQIIKTLKTKADAFETAYTKAAEEKAEEKTPSKYTGTLIIGYDSYITKDNIASVSFLETRKSTVPIQNRHPGAHICLMPLQAKL